MLAQNLFDFIHGGLHQVQYATRLQVELKFVGLELRHLRRLAHQPVQAIAFFVDHRHQFLAIVRTQARWWRAGW